MGSLQKKILNRISRTILGKFDLFPCEKSLEGLTRNMAIKYGYINTKVTGQPWDSAHKPIPWFTYPAIEYLKQLDLKEKKIFEWGSGNSSRFFAERCKEIVSVESNETWYNYGKEYLLPNQQLLFREEERFAESIDEEPCLYDIIVIDALRRYECALKAVRSLNKGGFIILDNSDWHPNTSQFLRVDCGLIEIDMHGFGPINDYSWTTSLYLHRDFCMSPKGGLQPSISQAGLHQISKYDTFFSDATPVI
jgi:hypothetical protein